MAYTTQQALETLNGYMSITDSQKEVIDDTKKRGYVVTLNSGEKVVIFVYPLVHKQDNTKNYFDTRDSGAYERGVTWRYALSNGLKYFCFGINDQVDKYSDYIFSLECNESVIEQISGTKNGSRNGPGNQIIIPNDYIPSKKYERIKNKLGIYISVIQKDVLFDYMQMYDNRPYLSENVMDTAEPIDEYQRASQIISDYITETGFDVPNNKEAENATLIEFKERFSPDVLAKLSDSEILQKLFYTSGDNTEALCYWLEHNAACREYFGSIAGGSSYKFGLFQKKDTGDWMTGSPQKPQVLTENQALETGKKIRDALIKGAEIIKNSTLESLSDFEKVDDELKTVIGEQYYNLAWFHKYFFMICPDKLSGFHSNDWQNHVLRCLRIVPSEKYYARSMQIAKVENYTNLSYSELFSVIYYEFWNIKNFVRL